MRVAAFDCGTNSLRLLVADLLDEGKRDVYRDMRIVRLGQGVDRTGMLSAEALQRTRQALVDYQAVCDRLGVERVSFVATSATRDAQNREEFVELVRAVVGAAPAVVTGGEEAALSFLGATTGLRAEQPVLVVDIGGGSTELVLGRDAVQAWCSIDVGCVRLSERHLHDDPPSADQVAAARADIEQALDLAAAQVPVGEARTVVGLAGSVTTIAALALGLESYQPERIHLSRIGAAEIGRVSRELLAMPRAARAALPVMHPGRVDVIGGGALVLLTLVERFGVPEVLVSESDILDGIALAMAGTG